MTPPDDVPPSSQQSHSSSHLPPPAPQQHLSHTHSHQHYPADIHLQRRDIIEDGDDELEVQVEVEGTESEEEDEQEDMVQDERNLRSTRRDEREVDIVSQPPQHVQVPMSMEHAISMGLGMGLGESTDSTTAIPVSATTTVSQDLSIDVVNPPPSTAQTKAVLAAEAPYLSVDWLDFTRTRGAQFIAEKTCEMICYLWFAGPSSKKRDADGKLAIEDDKSKDSTAPNTPPTTTRPSPTTLQLVAQPNFVSFMQKLLETTQVSQSVIVLSLHYIYRLKERNKFTPAQPGSEFRIAVAGLMMGNKFLDE